MADFAVWVSAAEEALPWDSGAFIAAYERNREEALRITLEHEPIADALARVLSEDGEFLGTATELLAKVRDLGSGDWSTPTSASALSQRLRRIVPALREIGIEVTWTRASDRDRTRLIAVRPVRTVQ